MLDIYSYLCCLGRKFVVKAQEYQQAFLFSLTFSSNNKCNIAIQSCSHKRYQKQNTVIRTTIGNNGNNAQSKSLYRVCVRSTNNEVGESPKFTERNCGNAFHKIAQSVVVF